MGRKLLTLVQLQTVIKEVKAVVNTRPLVYVGDDINSNITLSPNHFLTLNPRLTTPEVDLDDVDEDYTPVRSSADLLLKMWHKGQRLLSDFWRIWREDYLLNLRERTQTKMKSGRIVSTCEPNTGDIVLVKEDLPRTCWKIGKIAAVIQSSDGHKRSADVRMPSGRILRRPLTLLYPIEVSGQEQGTNEKEMTTDVPMNQRPPQRVAAKKASLTLKEQFK